MIFISTILGNVKRKKHQHLCPDQSVGHQQFHHQPSSPQPADQHHHAGRPVPHLELFSRADPAVCAGRHRATIRGVRKVCMTEAKPPMHTCHPQGGDTSQGTFPDIPEISPAIFLAIKKPGNLLTEDLPALYRLTIFAYNV